VKKAATIFSAAALAAFGLAAGGGDNNKHTTSAATTATGASTTAGTGGGATVDITAAADGSFKFDQSNLTAKAGTTTVAFDNPASLSHDVVLEDSGGAEVGRTDLISQSTASFTADLKPGTYTFFCDVPGHREGGMEGTITVK
jgi:plastocyanin